MTTYVIARITVTDPERYQRYLAPFREILSQYNGEILAAGSPEVLEGEESHQRLAMVSFPTGEDARRWYHSPEYQKICEDRLASSQAVLVLLEGAP